MKKILPLLVIILGCNSEPDTPAIDNNEATQDSIAETIVPDTITVAEQTDTVVQLTANVQTYYMNLPGELFMCDGIGNEDNKQFRLDAIESLNLEKGIINSNPQGFYSLEIYLFVNSETGANHIVSIIDCGMGCMCNHIGFWKGNDDGSLEEDWSIVPEEEIEEIQNGEYALVDYKRGASFEVYSFSVWHNPEADARPVYILSWNGSAFGMEEPVWQ